MLKVLSFLKSIFTHYNSNIPTDIYAFKVPSLNGTTIDFAAFKGKKILVVNTASKCGYTPQYEVLQQLAEKYGGRLVVVGFPSNSFLFQEPGTSEQIAEFCSTNYGVTFPMAEKVPVIGPHIAPIYRWLTKKKYNGYANSTVKWNFQKYLIDEQGKLIAIFAPGVPPDSPEVIAAIEK